MESERYSIGQLAAELGLNTKTSRYYEGLGLLALAARTAAGYRRYTDVERDALHFVVKAKEAGLTLAEIGDILALRHVGEEPCASSTCDGTVCGIIEHHAPRRRDVVKAAGWAG